MTPGGPAGDDLNAIERVERDIAKKGVNKERALLLFSLTLGPLPGVTLPDGDRGVAFEATLPALYLTSVWNELSNEQRQRAAILIGWEHEEGKGPSGSASSKDAKSDAGETGSGGTTPRGTGRPGTTPPGTTAGPPGAPRLRQASVSRGAPLAVAAAPVVFHDSTGAVLDAEYFRDLGQMQRNKLSSLTGTTIPGFIVSSYDYKKLGAIHAETTKWRQSVATGGAGRPYDNDFCNIDVFMPNFDGQSPTVNASIMAHEVFHCFQMTQLGSAEATASTGKWLLEGGATWAGLTVVPLPRGDLYKMDDAWDLYSLHPELPLFQRSYDAVGFFGHLGDVRGEAALWPLMLPAIVASSGGQNGAAFNLLVAGQEREILDSWGASYFRFADKKEWDMIGPSGVSTARISPTRESVAARADVVFKGAKPWEVETTELESSADIVKITTTSGNVRLLDAPLQRQVTFTTFSDISFCLRGSCTCPPGSSGFDELTINAAAPLNIGFTGARSGAAGYAQGFSLDDFCKNPQRAKPPMPTGGGGGGGEGGDDAGNTGVPGLDHPGGRSKGDPHLTTFDGLSYGFQSVGEYVLARSTTDDLSVQVRQEAFAQRRDVSVNTALATRVGTARVTITLEGERMRLRVEGRSVEADFEPLDGGSARRISTSTGEGFELEWNDGSVLQALPIGPFGINAHFVPAAARGGKLEGLLGNFDGKPDNDLVSRDGKKPIDPLSREDLYRDYGPSWRVQPATSLFDYRDGQSTVSFDDPDFPTEIVDPRHVPGRDAAERKCRDAGISEPGLLEECTVDLALTGKSAFLNGYATINRTLEAGGGTTTGAGHVFEGNITNAGDKPMHHFDATEGDIFWIGGDGCEDAGTTARLSDPAGKEVLVRPGCQLRRFAIAKSGTYTLALNIFGDKTGPYRLALEPVRHDRTGDARYGDELKGTIDHRAAHDVYRLDARAGDTLSISQPNCEDHQLPVDITDASGVSVSVGTGCQLPEVHFVKDGAYLITVNSNEGSSGSYRLPLRKR